MSIKDILIPKSLTEIRSTIPNRYTLAMIFDQIYDLNTGEKYNNISSTSDNATSDEELFKKTITAFRNGDEIVLGHEIYYGGFNYGDYIVLNDVFSLIQKWDLFFCTNIFNGEENSFGLELVNRTREEYYRFHTHGFHFRDRYKSILKDLELVNLHLKFEELGGSHQIPSRFTDLVQRAGWNNGVKMIKVILRMLARLQEEQILSRDNIQTRICDRLQSDEHDIIYKLSPGNQGHQIVTRHLFEEDITSVRVFKEGMKIYNEEIVEWGEFIND